MILSIVIPTIAGREATLERTLTAYQDRCRPGCEFETIVIRDRPTCGDAWNAGAELAQGEYLHFGADDLEPADPTWWAGAIAVCLAGALPVGWVTEHDQRFGLDFARVPFLRRDWWPLAGPMPEQLHYFTDTLITDRLARHGIRTCQAPGFDFFHHRSMVGRDETPERLDRDHDLYLAALAG